MKKRTAIISALWIAVGAWVVFIWSNSMRTGTASAGMSSPIAVFISGLLGLGEEHFHTVHLFIRKGAHFSEYFLLAALFCFALYYTFTKFKGRNSTHKNTLFVLISIPACFLVALFDEGIQTLTEGRGGAFSDVMIDTCGALVATLFFYGVLNWILYLVDKKIKRIKN